ncbi:MAG: AsmA family protein [Rickettsiales bacterium]|jgi:hypothetical protein|nr:AsmA family protein [Rickettsiales bacterium]
MRAITRYKIFWYGAIGVALLAMAYLTVPPLLNLSRYRADFSSAVSSFAGMPASVDGDMKLSLLGRPMIALDNVRIGDIKIKSMRFRISWKSILDLSNADIASAVKIDGARLVIKNLSMPDFGRRLLISNSIINYEGKDYEIIEGSLETGKLSARVRTDQHKYGLEVSGGDFIIRNNDEELAISGRLDADGRGAVSAMGTLSINSRNMNEWFDFAYPRLRERTKLKMNFFWDGRGYFDFSEISGTSGRASFSGRIRLWYEDGRQDHKSVRLRIENADLDLSFLTEAPDFLYRSDFNVVMSGRIKTPVPQIGAIKSLSAKIASSKEPEIEIQAFKAAGDKISVSASGRLIGAGAENLDLAFYQTEPAQSMRCVLSGAVNNWECRRWSFSSEKMSASGSIKVGENDFFLSFDSSDMRPDLSDLDGIKKYVSDRAGIINFRIGGAEGKAEIKDGARRVEYVQKNVELSSLPVSLPLPRKMLKTLGNIAADISGDKISFVFKAADWTFSADEGGGFAISHKSAADLLSALTGKPPPAFAKAGVPIVITGKYSASLIKDLKIKIADMILEGAMIDGTLTLKTDFLDLDSVLDKAWFDNFADNQYLAGDPLLAPFDFVAGLAVTADKVKLNDSTYAGFLYSLGGGVQNLSISDSQNGRMVLSVEKDKSKYRYLVQLAGFLVRGKLFGVGSQINIENTTVTAEAELESFGLTAHDIRRNMAGMIEASFDGGIIFGLGTDGFYDNANKYGKLDAEDALSKALGSGKTAIKEMRITGEYAGGDFRTSKPFLLTVRHGDITGNFSIKSDLPVIRANILLRGTSPAPKPVALTIDHKGRIYSLSDILRDLDLDYLREFVRSHDRF